MFETLSDRLSGVFDRLTKRGALTEADVSAALREVRVALLEADVALPVARDFIGRVKEKAVGQDVLRSVTPGQMVVKIVHDELVEMLGAESQSLNLDAPPPVVLMMVGLQGSGKTTTSAKIALRLKTRQKMKVLMASLDTRRPAAQEQLKILGEQVDVPTLPIVAGQSPEQIARRAVEAGRLGGHDAVILDTAGRTHIDEALMQEVARVRDIAEPDETLLVADSLTGQDAVKVAEHFRDGVGLTGVILTRVDGDGRGGAALSMRAVTGRPIKLIGVGEKLDALEDFHPERIAGRILGMGDVVSLVEKAAETVDKEKAEALAKKMKKGTFDLEDLADQFRQMRKMGGMQGLLGLLPGVGKMKAKLSESIDDKMLVRQEAIIQSMTPAERRNPKILNASRKRRVAKGAGLQVQDVNRLLKMHRQMSDVMKRFGKKGMKGLMGGMPPGAMPPGAVPGGMPGGMSSGGSLPGLGGPSGGMPALGPDGLPPGFPKGKK